MRQNISINTKDNFINKINQLNKKFYKLNANSFSKTRQYYWPGWEVFYQLLFQNKKFDSKLNILDIGCGNGRLAKFLFEQKKLSCKNFNYLGIDSSKQLIQTARNATNKNCVRFQYRDVLNSKVSTMQKYDYIFIIALAHHIPTYDLRIKIIVNSIKLLKSNGTLIISFWQFAKNPKIIDLEFDKQIKQKLFSDKLKIFEKNDYFLNWENKGIPRFCHHFSDKEIDQIIGRFDSKLKLIKKYSADSSKKLNKYLIFHKL